MQDTNQTHLNEATTVSDLDSISPRRFSRFGENFMRETISFAVSIVSDNNLQFFVVFAVYHLHFFVRNNRRIECSLMTRAIHNSAV